MRSKLLLLFAALLVLPLVSATTTINLKTLPHHTVFITIVEPQEDYQQIEIFKEIADFRGRVSIEYEEGTKPKIGILVVVKKGNIPALRERLSDYNTGQVIDVEVLPPGYVDPFEGQDDSVTTTTTAEANTTLNETQELEEQTNESETNTSNITGNVSLSLDGTTKSLITYIIGGILILAILAFIVVMVIVKKKKSSPDMPRKMKFDKKRHKKDDDDAELPKEKKGFFFGKKSSGSSKIDELERRLESLDTEIEELKEGDRIKKIEHKIAEKERMLKHLRHQKHLD